MERPWQALCTACEDEHLALQLCLEPAANPNLILATCLSRDRGAFNLDAIRVAVSVHHEEL